VLINCDEYTGIYDVKAESLEKISKSHLLVCGGTPIRPDGAGFLAVRVLDSQRLSDKFAGFFFADWSGKKVLMPLSSATAQRFLEKLDDLNILWALAVPAIYHSGWEGETAWVSWYSDRLRYDTKKQVIALDVVKPEEAEDGMPVKQHYTFAESKARLRVMAVSDKKKERLEPDPVRVEMLKPGQQKPQLILDRAEKVALIPSPNRKMVVLRCFVQNPLQRPDERILVVNQAGDVVAHLHVSK
jgi:hypothetical protein